MSSPYTPEHLRTYIPRTRSNTWRHGNNAKQSPRLPPNRVRDDLRITPCRLLGPTGMVVRGMETSCYTRPPSLNYAGSNVQPGVTAHSLRNTIQSHQCKPGQELLKQLLLHHWANIIATYQPTTEAKGLILEILRPNKQPASTEGSLQVLYSMSNTLLAHATNVHGGMHVCACNLHKQ
jgi:hypothetical protein